MNIFLVRHGRSTANEDKSIHTHTADHAIPLSDRGKQQATKAGTFLHKYLIGCEDYGANQWAYIHPGEHIRMWVSPYARARQTSQIMLANMGNRVKDVRENINLVEQQFGLFDGISHEGTQSQIQLRYPDEYAHYKKCEDFEGKFWARMPLGESRFDVCRRVHDMFGTVKRDEVKHNINNIIVVAHGLSNRAFVMQWLHLPYEWFEVEPNPPNCSIRLIQGDKDKGYIYEGGE